MYSLVLLRVKCLEAGLLEQKGFLHFSSLMIWVWSQSSWQWRLLQLGWGEGNLCLLSNCRQSLKSSLKITMTESQCLGAHVPLLIKGGWGGIHCLACKFWAACAAGTVLLLPCPRNAVKENWFSYPSWSWRNDHLLPGPGAVGKARLAQESKFCHLATSGS